MTRLIKIMFALTCGAIAAIPSAVAAEATQRSAEELAKDLASPAAVPISLPMQLNYDRKIGPAGDGARWTLNIQPVASFDLNDDWNIISRTIPPPTHQRDVFPSAGKQRGTGDVVQSLFFSLKRPTDGD